MPLGLRRPASAEGELDPSGHLFLVADGMGGHAGGEQASGAATASIEATLRDVATRMSASDEPDAWGRELERALRRADAAVCSEARRSPELRGMGTTLTMAVSIGQRLLIAHVGDSRCYLLRDGVLSQVTRDHTIVAQMVERGLIDKDDALVHQFRHVVTNVIGGGERGLRPELHTVDLRAGDVVLVCSDGLTEMVRDQTISSVLSAIDDPREACERLVALANDAGGRDNVTAVVARFT